MDEISLKRIELLHPAIREEVKNALLHINKKLLGVGVRMRITQGLRTIAEQNELYSQGRTKAGKNVTNAKGGQSFHNFGLAFDFVILLDKKGDGSFKDTSWVVDKNWMVVVNYLKSLGFVWGGDFKTFKDTPHFEKVFGNTWQKLLEKHNKKDFIKGTDYVNL